MKKYSTCLMLLSAMLLNINMTPAQQLEIEGSTLIRGNLDLSQMFDASTVCIGIGAGQEPASLTSKSNTLVGYCAGSALTSGSNNTFFGRSSGFTTSTGERNAFFGTHAGFLNQANYNTFIGSFAGYRNTSGVKNSFLGELAGSANTSGDFNVYLGANAGFLATEADKNVFVGSHAGEANSTGSDNVFIGESAGSMVTTGSRNTLIGTGSNIGYVQVENATAIGYEARVMTGNSVRIGNREITIISGQVPFTSSSDKRLKEKVVPIDLGLAFIDDLNPVKYHRIANEGDDLEMGLIAQELVKTLQDYAAPHLGIVQEDADGMLMVRYNDLIPVLIKAIQELVEEQKQMKKILGGLIDHTDSTY